jgi:hypothetical protein
MAGEIEPETEGLLIASDVDTREYIRIRRLSLKVKLDQPKLVFTLDAETGMPSGCSIYEVRSYCWY